MRAGPKQSAKREPDLTGMAPAGRLLGPEFFDRDTVAVARDLLGKVLVRTVDGEHLWGRLVEVEAYLGPDDLAAHSSGGRRSPRNEVMYGPPGHAYVYFTYGMHFCVNLVCQPAGEAAAVLLRAGRVVQGKGLAISRRTGAPGAGGAGLGGGAGLAGRADRLGQRPGSPPDGTLVSPGHLAGRRSISERDLARGPARLCQALGIGRAQNGADVCDPAGRLRLLAPAGTGCPATEAGGPATEAGGPPAAMVSTGPRVGVRNGADAQWRFWVTDEPTVSPYRPHAPRRAAGPGAADPGTAWPGPSAEPAI